MPISSGDVAMKPDGICTCFQSNIAFASGMGVGVAVGVLVGVDVFVGVRVLDVDVGVGVGVSVGVGVIEGARVAVGTSAVCVANMASAAWVAVVSNSAWDGPQAHKVTMTTKPPKLIIIFCQFIDQPPKLSQV